ncbi:MAG TPA: TolC family protein, partial [Burkholderiales bacterium]|nr:TolC family protein [Burkholderiales bacterium]
MCIALAALALDAKVQARDLTLPEAESLLVRNNRELQAARRGMESADAQRVIAGARPNATFSVNASSINDANTIEGQKRTADTVLRIDQPFERGNKRGLRLDAASGLQRAARHDYLDVLRQQVAVLQGAYFDLKLGQEKARTLSENAQLFSGTLAAAQRRLQAGDLAPADVAKVQVDYERAQNDARTAQAELARAQLALAYLLALDAEAPELRATDPWPPLERADAMAIQQAIDARPDVAAARARVEAAEKMRDLAR